jgi:NitT/TauT family transport system substrate-binding protein
MMQKPLFRVIAVAVILTILITACGPAATPEPTSPPEPEVCEEMDLVKGTFVPIVSYAPIYVAMDKGFWEKYCIENTLERIGYMQSLPLVAAGEYDWGRTSNGAGFINAMNEGLELYAVVDRLTYTCTGDNAFVTSAQRYNEGYTKFEDFKGMTLALNAPGTTTCYWQSIFAERYGLEYDDFEYVYLGYSDILAALETGSVDAGYMTEPLLTDATLSGDIVPLIPSAEASPGLNIGMVAFGKKFTERKDGDIAVRWIAAWLEAIRWAQDPANRDELIEIIAKWTEVEPEVLGQIYDDVNYWPQANPNGYVDVDFILDEFGAYILGTGDIDRVPTSDEYMNRTWLDLALEIVGEVPVEDYQRCP